MGDLPAKVQIFLFMNFGSVAVAGILIGRAE
jgi:hypothetical protein